MFSDLRDLETFAENDGPIVSVIFNSLFPYDEEFYYTHFVHIWSAYFML